MSRVLIVDDKDENLYYLQVLLSARGYEVETARHGAEALVKARQSPPDLVVSDLLMPVMDGYTLLRNWKADPLLRNIKFVVYTATYTQAQDERLAISLGADAFILKPAEPEHFVASIEKIQANAETLAAPARVQVGNDDALMQSYSETLIRKLEEKSLQLEETNRALLNDIAGREQAEAELLLLNSAVLQSTEAVLITDAELDPPGPRIVFANPAFSRMTGYGLDEIIGKTPRILQGPRTDQAVLRRLRAELGRGETFSGSAVNYRKDGSEYEQEWQVVPIKDPQGKITHYVAVQRDVSARNEAARALQQSNDQKEQLAVQLGQERQRLLAAQRVANVGSWDRDLASGDLAWSDETHRIHETDPGDFQPTHALFMEMVHPDDRARVEQAFAESAQRGDSGVVEHRLLLPDGRIKHIEKRWRVEFDEKRRSLQAIGTCQDVSERRNSELALRNLVDRLELATKSASIGIWDWAPQDNVLVFDAQMMRFYGLNEGEVGDLFEEWTLCLHPDDRDRVLTELSDTVVGTRKYGTRFRIIRKDGQVRDIEAHGLVQRAADGTALRMIGTNRDITHQTEVGKRLLYLNRVHAMMSSINALIVRTLDRGDLFQRACQIAVDEGGFQLAMIGVVVPRGLDFIAMAGDNDENVELVRQFVEKRGTAPSPMAARAMHDGVACVSNASQSDRRFNSRELPERFGNHSMAVLPLLLGEPSGVLALYAEEADFFHADEVALLTQLASDLAIAVDRLTKRDELAYLTYYDALTGLANRSLFLERVGQYARSAATAGKNVAVLIFDLERFSNINDSLGRDAGDHLLRQVAAWLTKHLGDVNLLARIEADHFGIVLPQGETDGDFASVIQRMMDTLLGETFKVFGESIRIAARAGVSCYPDDAQDADGLFNRAEAALQKAHSSGARYLFYAQHMTDAAASKRLLESQLRKALEDHEFVLHYQPKVKLREGLLSGAEALIRWNDPRNGLRPPAHFIPILEETGMINDVGRWALHQAVSDWLRWRESGLAVVPIAVNVSARQLRDPEFISHLQQAISVSEDVAQGLELEITESMVMHDMKQTIATLDAIRNMGIRVAIDDFGTGFSSLGYLRKLPVDTLKIDRLFITDMVESAEGLGMVSTMLTLAQSLKLKVIAEGVETEEQANLLALLQCDEIQGHLISPALPCAEFEASFLTTDWHMS